MSLAWYLNKNNLMLLSYKMTQMNLRTTVLNERSHTQPSASIVRTFHLRTTQKDKLVTKESLVVAQDEEKGGGDN